MFSFLYTIKRPPSRLRSRLKTLKPKIWNWFIGNMLSSFNSEIRNNSKALTMIHYLSSFNYDPSPWSIGCVQEIVFGSKNCNLIAFSPEASGCAGQLPTIITIFLPCISNLRSSSRNHSSESVPSIHTFFWDRYLQGRLRTCLKHLGLADFPIPIPIVFHLNNVYLGSAEILIVVPRRTDQIYLH